jgi:hypothetical protein
VFASPIAERYEYVIETVMIRLSNPNSSEEKNAGNKIITLI